MSVFSGIWVPLVTPFSNGSIDHAAIRRLVRFYADARISGLVALATTGEAAALDSQEQLAVLETVLDSAGSSLPVIAGLSGNHAGHLREALQRFTALPIAGIQVAAPYYVRPSQQGLIEHFSQLADLSSKPLVIYDIPYRTGVNLELATLLTLAAHPQIQAIKDCGGSLAKTVALIADGRLQVLAGEDLNIFNNLCLGGSGAISASAHVRPDLFVALADAVAAQQLDQARAIFYQLAPLIQVLNAEPNPAPIKALLANQGWIQNELRSPMTVATPALQSRLQEYVV